MQETASGTFGRGRLTLPQPHAPEQLLFPFAGEAEPRKAGSVILFHLPRTVKESLADKARKEGKSTTGMLNELIAAYITPKKKVGRGNVDVGQVEKVKQILRARHPGGVGASEIARHVGCTRVRAERLLDILSGGSDGRQYDFTVYEDDSSPALFYMAKDSKTADIV